LGNPCPLRLENRRPARRGELTGGGSVGGCGLRPHLFTSRPRAERIAGRSQHRLRIQADTRDGAQNDDRDQPDQESVFPKLTAGSQTITGRSQGTFCPFADTGDSASDDNKNQPDQESVFPAVTGLSAGIGLYHVPRGDRGADRLLFVALVKP